MKLGVHSVNILYFTNNYRIVEKQGVVGSLVDCTSEGAALGALLVKIIRVSRMMMIRMIMLMRRMMMIMMMVMRRRMTTTTTTTMMVMDEVMCYQKPVVAALLVNKIVRV